VTNNQNFQFQGG